MIHTVPVEYKSIDEIMDNIDKYKEKFIEDSVVVFRNANLSFDEQLSLHKSIGESFGWQTHREEGSHYKENHSHNPNVGVSGSDEIMLTWHVEHFYYSNPIVAGTWNMFHLNAEAGAGKTYFVDTSKVYELLDEDMKDFLSNCILKTKTQEEFWPFATQTNYKAVLPHWLTNKPVIRISLSRWVDDEIFSINEKPPTEKDYEMFRNSALRVIDLIEKDESIRIVHDWKQGDLVLMDAFKLAHAVTGGFKSEDREFTGIWGYRDPIKYVSSKSHPSML
jgi:alpha-ketoglutarate-dependent taurine dioxygenase